MLIHSVNEDVQIPLNENHGFRLSSILRRLYSPKGSSLFGGLSILVVYKES